MSVVEITAEFIGSPAQRILISARHPRSFDGRCVLLCPAFAEEMNKSRKMMADLSQRLAHTGMAVVVPDLFGTGDSEGDFSAATWHRWLQDLRSTQAWIAQQGWHLESLVGIRLGCALAAQYAQSEGLSLSSTVFWQPVLDGARALDHLLRVRVAASLMRDSKESVSMLKEQLDRGEVVDVAGYGLSPELARELQGVHLLELMGSSLGRVHWFEVVRSLDAAVPQPVAKAQEQLLQRDLAVELHTVVGEPFWASTEIVLIEELLNQTSKLFSGVA